MSARPAAVAGMFYPSSASEIRTQITRWINLLPASRKAPKALIVPHAGYMYSGPTAAATYQTIQNSNFTKVVVAGPNHRVSLQGIALPSSDSFLTPLGALSTDPDSLEALIKLDGVVIDEEAHRLEHCIEVQLPFLQSIQPEVKLIPILVGKNNRETLAKVLKAVWGDEQTLMIISSDLSHYLPYEDAQKEDEKSIKQILHGDATLNAEQACGCYAINGLLQATQEKGLQSELIAHCNSGDMTGDKSKVVGYASFIFF